jgi:hypothetical protein
MDVRMAQQTTVRFIDDLDGSNASGTFDFSLEGPQLPDRPVG